MFKPTYIPALFLIATLSAHATQIISSDIGLSNPDQTLTFSEVVMPPDRVLSDQYSAFGVSFTGGGFFTGFIYNGPVAWTAPPDGAKPDTTNFATDVGADSSPSIHFATPVSGAAFDCAGVLAGSSFPPSCNSCPPFGSHDAPFVLDNLETTAAPEPATLLLCSAGMLILALSRRLCPKR
jgi:hypothetical protein